MSRHPARDWWKKGEKLAEIAPKRRRGWHALPHKFASDLKGIPLKTLCEVGGWNTYQTMLMCYQHVEEGGMREALESRRTGT